MRAYGARVGPHIVAGHLCLATRNEQQRDPDDKDDAAERGERRCLKIRAVGRIDKRDIEPPALPPKAPQSLTKIRRKDLIAVLRNAKTAQHRADRRRGAAVNIAEYGAGRAAA